MKALLLLLLLTARMPSDNLSGARFQPPQHDQQKP
jgi:hypothetical protein